MIVAAFGRLAEPGFGERGAARAGMTTVETFLPLKTAAPDGGFGREQSFQTTPVAALCAKDEWLAELPTLAGQMSGSRLDQPCG